MKQVGLFGEESAASPNTEHFELPDAELAYVPQLFSKRDADHIFERLQNELAWQQHEIRIAGLQRQQPRLSAWYGDADAHYSYSNLALHPLAWHPLLAELKNIVEDHSKASFNSVLANLYRNQDDSMGWHADDEPELGPAPVIASLSFGEARDFLIRHQQIKTAKHAIRLEHGSLLIMAGRMQSHWQHAIAKQKFQLGPRINLTFRQVYQNQLSTPRK